MVPPLGAIGEKIQDVLANCKVELKSARTVSSSSDTEGDLERLLNVLIQKHFFIDTKNVTNVAVIFKL